MRTMKTAQSSEKEVRYGSTNYTAKAKPGNAQAVRR